MDRPPSVEELIAQTGAFEKPKFIPRSKRGKEAPQRTAKRKKTPLVLNPEPEEEFQPLVTAPVSQPVGGSYRHWSEKQLSEMTPRDWRILRNEYDITYKGKTFNPLRSWKELVPEAIAQAIAKAGYKEPTPIQRGAIPVALHGDVVGVAKTGSGKTLAFLVPILASILQNGSDAIQGLILAPTRELVLQIAREAEKFTRPLGLKAMSIIGGHLYEETVHQLQSDVQIVVATPGRLVDSLDREMLSLRSCTYLTLDEADKMIDMGFEKELDKVLLHLPTTRTTLMFTATITPQIEKLTHSFLSDPTHLFVGGANELVESINQRFEYVLECEEKQSMDKARFARLLKVIGRLRSTIVFANYKNVVEQIADALAERGHGDCVTIHGLKSQAAREAAIEKFRLKKASVLVATDVAARGLDVPHVSLVVNFQMSAKFEEYIHRIGRTGRAGLFGESFTFLDDSDRPVFNDLRKFLVKGGVKVPEWLLQAILTS